MKIKDATDEELYVLNRPELCKKYNVSKFMVNHEHRKRNLLTISQITKNIVMLIKKEEYKNHTLAEISKKYNISVMAIMKHKKQSLSTVDKGNIDHIDYYILETPELLKKYKINSNKFYRLKRINKILTKEQINNNIVMLIDYNYIKSKGIIAVAKEYGIKYALLHDKIRLTKNYPEEEFELSQEDINNYNQKVEQFIKTIPDKEFINFSNYDLVQKYDTHLVNYNTIITERKRRNIKYKW